MNQSQQYKNMIVTAVLVTIAVQVSSGLKEPVLNTKGKLYQGRLGDSIQLECSVSFLGRNVLLWKQGPRVLTAGGMKVRRDPRLELKGTDLLIKNLELEDRGEYDCEVESDREVPVSIRHSLDILHPPTAFPEPNSGGLIVKQGTLVTLKCGVTGNPLPTVTWTKDGELLQDGQSITVYNINRFHAGEYKCTAVNGIGEPDSAIITMDVLYPPVVESEYPRVLGGVGRKVELSCKVLAQPEPEIKWFKNTNQEIKPEPGVRSFRSNQTHHVLTFHHMHEIDFGDYFCEGLNSLGSGKSRILVSGKPEEPIVEDKVRKIGEGAYSVSWSVRSYRPILEHILYYRKTQSLTENGWTRLVIHKSSENLDIEKTTFTLQSLEEDQEYQVQVESKNFFGVSRLSKPVLFKTYKSETDTVVNTHEEGHFKNLLFFRSGSNSQFIHFSRITLAISTVAPYLLVYIYLPTYIYL